MMNWEKWFGAGLMASVGGSAVYWAFAAQSPGLGARVALGTLGIVLGGGGAVLVLLFGKRL